MEAALNKPDYTQIRSELQQIILDIKGDALHKIPDDVPILDLGVSSLELVEGMRRVYERFGVLVSIRRVIEGQVTLGGLGLYIEQELGTRQAQKKKDLAAKTPAQNQRELPLASSQRHVEFLSRYSDEANAAYNEALAVRLHGQLDGPALQAALEEAANRCEALRSALHPHAASLLIASGEAPELMVTAIQPGRLDQYLAELVQRPFHAGERLLRAGLLRIGEDEHILLLAGHQLVLETQALQLVLEEIAALYRAFSQDKPAPLPLPTLQWSDYLALGQTNEARQAAQQAQVFWKERLSGGLPGLELPTDHPRPLLKQYQGERLVLEMEPDLSQSLQNNSDPALALLTAYALYLHRLSGQTELIIGVESLPFYSPSGLQVTGRSRGYLPLQSSYDPGQPYQQYAHKLAADLQAAQANRQLSLSELVQMLDLPRDQSRSALFTVAFRSLEICPAPNFSALQASWQPLPGPGARFDLDLCLELGSRETRLACDFSSELFSTNTIQRWLAGVQTLLRASLSAPQTPCGLLPVLSPAERYQIEVGWNQTVVDFPRQATVLDQILIQAQTRPQDIAIRYQDQQLTYQELTSRLQAYAALLFANGVTRGERIGILLPRSLDLVPALLAVWRIGALYVPLDAAFPPARLAFMIEDASVKRVLCNRSTLSLLAETPGLGMMPVEDATQADMAALEDISPANGPESAMLLFTSGSTGKPKAVEIRHAALLNVLLAVGKLQNFRPGHSMLALTTLTFDISEYELLMPLMTGGSVDIGEEGLVADGSLLADRLAQRRPSHMQATPSTWKAILAAGWSGAATLCAVSAGEALSRDLAEALLGKCAQLWNLYGPTETTVYSASYRVSSLPGQAMRIGRPLPNTQFYILDPQLQSPPLGAIGEIYIGGESLSAGYWGQPELTTERFIASPFEPGQRLYRTGDLGYYLPSGELVCLGRNDNQVKVHGVRIELDEVELALRRQAGVQDALVTSWLDPHGDAQLVAHIILQPGSMLSAQDLRLGLRLVLPAVMIPPYILFSQAFPRTANGKVRRAGLPTPLGTSPDATHMTIEPPSGPTEQAAAQIWARVLGIDPALVGRETDFFNLGGHSLLMTQLMVEVRQAFGITFSLRELFAASSLSKFALLVDEISHRQAAQSAGPAARSVNRSAEWARQRMAFLAREAELPAYIAPRRGLLYQPSPLERVLLTGATGFLGTYLLSRILTHTRAELTCLVRAKRGQDGRQRIEDQVRKYGLWVESPAWRQAWQTRLHVVEGDVTLPRLGLESAVYERLARETDAIFNGAAHVNFIYPYEALRATNVLGLHELLQFAFYQRIKPVHHLSTAAIWPMGAQFTFYENDPIEHNALLNLGYDEAKWTGEKVLLNAAERGLPLARYRPGEVGGDSLTGRCVTDHFLVACVKGFLQFGAFPQMDIQVDVAPVDYVAQAMVHLAFERNPLGRAFHLTNPEPHPMREALDYLRALGYRFEELPFSRLRDQLVNSSGFAGNALFAYQAALEEMDDVSMQLPGYDTRAARRELSGSGISCPPADVQLFGVYLRYLQQSGFIPLPETAVTD